eukprot:5232220-Alexandrium_andersonii.AAC.1
MLVDKEGDSRSRGAVSACERPAPGAEPSEFASSAAVPGVGPEPGPEEAGQSPEASMSGARTERMPMPTEPTRRQRMQALPPVP